MLSPSSLNVNRAAGGDPAYLHTAVGPVKVPLDGNGDRRCLACRNGDFDAAARQNGIVSDLFALVAYAGAREAVVNAGNGDNAVMGADGQRVGAQDNVELYRNGLAVLRGGRPVCICLLYTSPSPRDRG